MFFHARYDSPLGEIGLLSDDNSLLALWFDTQTPVIPDGPLVDLSRHGKDVPILRAACDWLDRYFVGDRPSITDLSLAPVGTAFRHRVWQLLVRIPYGETTTYGAIAREMAIPNGLSKPTAANGLSKPAARAVGGAVGSNPLALIIPCHRVVGAGGKLTGYGGGLELKKRLLLHEGVDIAAFVE